jgi:putative spermidine/putrescine transport system ATP-binding protein
MDQSVNGSSSYGRLELRGMRRAFGSHVALASIDLTIEQGEFIALLGPSGCGKSTALNCIAGLLPLTGGFILLGGKRIDMLQPEDRGFGMVFQSYALFPHMSVHKNVGFGLAMRKVAKREADARINEALALVRLQDQADKRPGQMSGGQQQRVAIARAIVVRPPIVLMDEPLSNLDAKLRLEMRGEIRRIHGATGATTIYVTHDQDEALSLADRIVVMTDGVIRQTGTPEDLYERPVTRDVADFMGYRNHILGRAVSVRDRTIEIEACGARLTASTSDVVREGDAVTICVRPEDLIVCSDASGIAAKVKAAEYRGRAFFGTAVAADGTEVFFRSDVALLNGEQVFLRASADRIRVFARSGDVS